MPRKQAKSRKLSKDSEANKIMKVQEENNFPNEDDLMEKKPFRYFMKHELNFSESDGWDDKKWREQMVKRRDFMIWTYKKNLIRVENQLKAMKCIKTIQRVNLMSNQDRPGKGRKDLQKFFKTKKCLQTIFHGREPGEEGNQRLKELTQVFPNLQNITLETEPGKDYQKIIQNLRKLRNLQNIHLKLSNDKITGQEQQDLNNVFRRLPHLQNFTFGCFWSESPEFQRISEDLRKLPILQKIRLSFLNPKRFDDYELQKLSKDLKKFSSLQNLSFNLPHFMGISDKGLKILGESLKELNSVQRLNLIFFNSEEMTNKGIKLFSESFKGLTGLKSLHLGFDAIPKMTDTGMAQVGKGLAKLKSLQHINIYTSRCPKISDKGLKSLIGGLKKLECLESFALKICACEEEVDNKGALALNETLKELKNLQKLNLAFHNITGKGLEALAETLENAENVKYLRLKFGEYLKATHKGMKMLVDGLKKMPCLEQLEVILATCDKTVEGKFKRLGESLEGLNCEITWNSRFFDGSFG